MLGVDVLVGNVVGQVMQQMADVVEQRGDDQRRRRALSLGQPGGLQRMLLLAHALAVVVAAAPPKGRVDRRDGGILSRHSVLPSSRASTRRRLSTPSRSM